MKNNHINRLSIAFVVLTTLVGCTTPPNKDTFYWGQYEDLLYAMNVDPGTLDPAQQIEILVADIQNARLMGKPVAPGIQAHLGMMYAANGESSLARAAFAAEKASFPESAILMDGMMARIAATGEK